MEGVMVAGGGARVPLSKLPKPHICSRVRLQHPLCDPKGDKVVKKGEKKILRNKNQRLNCSFLIIGYMGSSKDQ